MAKKTRSRKLRSRRARSRRVRSQRGGSLRFESIGKENERNTVVTVFSNPRDELENVPTVTTLSKARAMLTDE